MSAHRLRCLIIADFNAANLAGLMTNDLAPPLIEPVLAPYGQWMQVLLDASHACWSPRPDITLVWVRPGNAVACLKAAMDMRVVDYGQMAHEVDEYAALLLGAAQRTRFLLAPAWTATAQDQPICGVFAWNPERGAAHALARAKLRLQERIGASGTVFQLDADHWLMRAEMRASHNALWYLSKTPFGNDVFRAAVGDIKAAARGLLGEARKLLVLDLDDTLWGGILGDVGPEGIALGGHDARGEAFEAFQEALRSLLNRGILLGIVSKNDEQLALRAIAEHPAMKLRRDDFAGWRINWRDKAENVADLAAELNLGLQSVVFIDDNPVERDRLRSSLPEVLVPEWPSDPFLYRSALAALACFDTPVVTADDVSRSREYNVRRERDASRAKVANVEDWLLTLGTVVKVEAIGDANRVRALQLINKTNQMNLRTRRLTEAELVAWFGRPGCAGYCISVSDRFGDSGLTGFLGLRLENGIADITDYVISCRVLGRGVEESMVWLASTWAREAKANLVRAEYLATSKNAPCLDFWRRSGFRVEAADRIFVWPCETDFPRPRFVEVSAPPVGCFAGDIP